MSRILFLTRSALIGFLSMFPVADTVDKIAAPVEILEFTQQGAPPVRCSPTQSRASQTQRTAGAALLTPSRWRNTDEGHILTQMQVCWKCAACLLSTCHDGTKRGRDSLKKHGQAKSKIGRLKRVLRGQTASQRRALGCPSRSLESYSWRLLKESLYSHLCLTMLQ